MRRLKHLTYTAVAVAACTVVAAVAATLGGINSNNLYSSSQPEPRCTPTINLGAAGLTFTTATATGYTAACNGQTINITIHNIAGTALATGTATLTAPSTTIGLSTAVIAANATGAAATVGQLGIPATLTITPPTPTNSIYQFNAGSLNAATTPTPPAGLTTTAITQGPSVGIFGVMNNNGGTLLPNDFGYANQPQIRWSTAGTTTTPAAAVAAGTYIQFTITAPTTGTINFTSLNFIAARGGTSGPRGLVVRSSLNSYATNLFSSDITAVRNNMSPYSVNLTAQPTISNGATATFRIYLYAPSNGSTMELDNLTLNYGVS